MIREYKTAAEITGPLMVVRRVQGAAYDEMVEMIKEASKVVKEVRFVGWDVGISEKGPCLIEGNDYPGHDICGMPELCKDGYGILPEIEKYMPR